MGPMVAKVFKSIDIEKYKPMSSFYLTEDKKIESKPSEHPFCYIDNNHKKIKVRKINRKIGSFEIYNNYSIESAPLSLNDMNSVLYNPSTPQSDAFTPKNHRGSSLPEIPFSLDINSPTGGKKLRKHLTKPPPATTRGRSDSGGSTQSERLSEYLDDFISNPLFNPENNDRCKMPYNVIKRVKKDSIQTLRRSSLFGSSDQVSLPQQQSSHVVTPKDQVTRVNSFALLNKSMTDETIRKTFGRRTVSSILDIREPLYQSNIVDVSKPLPKSPLSKLQSPAGSGAFFFPPTAQLLATDFQINRTKSKKKRAKTHIA